MSNAAYRIEYLFFEKEMVAKSSSRSGEEGSFETGDSGDSSCRAAYITQELIMVDRKVMRKRIRAF